MNLGSLIQYPPPRAYHGGVLFPIDYPDPANVDRLDHGALPLIDRMHGAGIWLDRSALGELDSKLAVVEAEVLAAIRDNVTQAELGRITGGVKPFNPGSPDQVAALLYGERGLDKLALTEIHETRSRKRLSTDDDALILVAKLDPLVPMLQDYRGITKLRSTYTLALPFYQHPETGCIHTTFDPTTVVSGRLASRRPNLMNIPIRGRRTKITLLANAGKHIRNCFRIRPDYARKQRHRGKRLKLISIDLSQIEMVVAAYIAGDETMKRVFRDGKDMHTFTALGAFGAMMTPAYLESIEKLGSESEYWEDFKSTWRLVAKTVGFGILYGQEAAGLQQSIYSNGGPMKSEEDCAKFIKDWYALYSGIRQWSWFQHGRARRFRMVWDLVGRHRWVPAGQSNLAWVQSGGLREAGNTPVQSLAQALLKLAMAIIDSVVESYQQAGYMAEALLQIHDELVFEVEESICEEFSAVCKQIMETVVELDIPIKSSYSVADQWGDLK